MNNETFNTINNWFISLVKEYEGVDGKLPFLLQLKFDHSYRVLDNCCHIANELKWDEDKITAAKAIALLHDIARFPQFKEFETFQDRKSFDHGERSYEMTRDSGMLDSCPEHERNAILDAIRYHNKKELPFTDSEHIDLFHIIRDADKIDIMQVVCDAIKNDQIKDHPELLLGIDPDGPSNPKLIEEVLSGKAGSYENVKSAADINLMRASWVYMLYFVPSLRIVVERGLLKDTFDSLPKTTEIKQIIENANSFAENKLRQL